VQQVFGNSQNITGGQFAVSFSYRGESARSLEQWTSQNINQPMCIVIDNVVQSCATVQNTLVGGSGQITTGTEAEADSIYNQLKYGALPVSLAIESSRTVSASLGADSVQASLVAGVVGLLAVMLFLILYYRLPGLVAVVVLLIYTSIIFALYRLMPVTLTLAGIAGFILSVGVIVDANVLINGRVKEELRRGRTARAAVDNGSKQAWSAILDSSIAMLITSLILFFFGNSFGVSIIKGFAITLGLGTLLSLIIAGGVTPALLRLVLPHFAQRSWLMGIEQPTAPERAEAAA
jgi:preprotein translocase subunit SecD